MQIAVSTLYNDAPGGLFEAYWKPQSKTVSININMLACSAYWSTIKTLPATLPEASSENRGSRAKVQEPRFTIPRQRITYQALPFNNLGHRSALEVHRTQDRASRTSGLEELTLFADWD